MTTLSLLIVLAAFAAGTCAVLAIASLLHNRQASDEQLQRRMGVENPGPDEVPTELLARDATNWIDRRFYALLADSGLRISASVAVVIVLGMSGVCALLAFIISEQFPVAILGAVVGLGLPIVWWLIQRTRRVAAMQRLLPGALDQIADSLHGGQTLEQAAEMVSIQTASPLKEEFGYCVALLKMGQSPVAVMERMSRRIPLPEFGLFATAVLVHRQTGGNLARLTSRLANSARDRQEALRHVGAQSVAARYSAIGMIVCGAIGFLILSFNTPQYMEFFTRQSDGLKLLALAAVLVIVGTYWVSRIVRTSY